MNTIKISPTTSIGFLVGTGAWSLSFITLIWGYIAYRLRAGQWLAGYINETVWEKVLVNTGLLILASWALHLFLRQRKMVFFPAGILTATFFIKGQWDLWTLLLDNGLTLRNSLAGSFLYLLTGFHAAHILIALAILMPLGVHLAQRNLCATSQRRFQFALKFWDLLLFFWLVLLLLIFVLK